MITFRIQDNKIISDFLSGDDSYIPTSELQYLHTHPLIRPNFITEIQELVDKVGLKIVSKNVKGKPIDKLEKLAIDIGTSLESPLIDNDDARKILLSLRKLYKLCLDLDSSL